MPYRVTRTEPRVTVGNGPARDMYKGEVWEAGEGTRKLPQEELDYLEEHGLVVQTDDTEDNPWFNSKDPDLAGDDNFAANVEERVRQEVKAAYPEGTEVDVKVNVTPPKEEPAKAKTQPSVTSTKTSSTAKG